MKTLILRVDLQIPEHQEREFFVDKFQTFFDSYHPSLRAAVSAVGEDEDTQPIDLDDDAEDLL
jgi:hypothetical protein